MSTKVLSIVPTGSLAGGGEKSFYELMKFMQSKGLKNYVIVPRDSQQDFLKTLKDSEIEYVIGTYATFGLHHDHSLSEVNEALNIATVIRNIKPDVMMTNLYIEPSQWAAALCDVPHIYFDRGQLGLLDNQNKLSDIPPTFIKYSNAIACNSKNSQNILKKYNTDSSLIYSYVNKPIVTLRKYKKPRLILPANFFREKNHLDILAAVSRIKSKKPELSIEIIFMGATITNENNEYLNQIKSAIKSHQLENQVYIIDHQSDPWEFFSENDIYINSGEGEAVGRATIEAEMLGITALIADIPGHWEHKEILGNNNLFKLHDVDDLSNKIEYLIDPANQSKIKKHNKRIQKNTLEWMNPENTMGSITSLIEEVKNQHNPARTLVYQDILYILNQFKDNYYLVSSSESLANERKNEKLIEIERLREPTVKLAFRKLCGAIKRSLIK